MLTPRGQRIAALIADVETGEVFPNQSIDVNPEAFVNPPVANELLFETPSGPISAANVNSGQSLTVTTTSIQSGSGSNIQGVNLGGPTVAFSGLWKFTARIKAGERGKSSSVVWNGSTDVASAIIQARTWAAYLADTFGNEGPDGNPNLSGGAASPIIRSIRISDAIFPRQGSLLKLTPDVDWVGKGTGSAGDNNADFISTALSLRLTCTTDEPNPPAPDNFHQVVYANHALYGIPDRLVINGDQMNLGVVVGSATWQYYAALYISFLTNVANKMGAITTPITQKTFQCINFTRPANALWQFNTTEAHGYVSGDRVRLTRCNAPFFSGSYVVTVVDATTLKINNGPPEGIAAPTKGQVRRYMSKDGVRYGVFAQFSLTGAETAPPWNLAVSKRNPGRAPALVSFRRRPRRPH